MENKINVSFSTVSGNYQLPTNQVVKNNNGYISWGMDNQYPNHLLSLFLNSALHNAITTGKVDYITGDGLVEDYVDTQLTSFVKKCNSKGDSLNDLFKKCSLDYEIFGGFAIQVVYQKLGGKIAELYYVDFAKLRYNADGTKIKYSKDWSLSRVRTQEYSLFDTSDPTGTQIFYYNGSLTRDFYPVPVYIGSTAAIETDIEISNFHLNQIKSGMFPSLMIDFKNGEPTEEEKAAIEKRIHSKWGGTSNAGKIMLSFSDADNPSPEIIPIEQPDLDARFTVLQDSVKDRIFIGHRVTSPILFGVQSAGKLGNTNEFSEGYEIFKNTYVKPAQKTILDIFDSILSVNFPEVELEIKAVPPLNVIFSTDIIANNMTREEIRTKMAEWGYIDSKDIKETIKIEENGPETT